MSDEIIGGLLTGLGSGIIDNHRRKREDAIARRQEFLEDARAARMRRETVQDRDFQVAAQYDQLEAQLAATREENEKNRQTQIEIAESQSGLAREEGEKDRQTRITIAELRSGVPGRGDGVGASTPQEIQQRKEEAQRLIGISMRMNDPLDNNPEKSRNFLKAVNTASALIDSGYPMHKVTEVAIGAANERPLPIEEAKKIAKKQLANPWLIEDLRGHEHQERIKNLAKKLMIESRLYGIRLRQMHASVNDLANMPRGIGTQESPLIIETNQNKEWLERYMLPGQYIKFGDRVATVTEPGSAYSSSSQ